MQTFAPYFIESPYLIVDQDGWRLKEDAPKKLKKDFKKYIDSLSMNDYLKKEVD